MFIQNTLEIINAFADRYIGYVNESGDYTKITTVDEKVKFTFNNDYSLLVWIENDELKIENERGESIFDYADCYEWTEEDVNYIRFGRR